MSNPQLQTSDELEVAESQNSLFDLLYDFTARVLSTRVGQFAYRRVDSLLSTVEKTARWSVPQTPATDDGSGKLNIAVPPLVRPLPWLLFLPALVALRLIRVFLSLLALMVGRQPVYPSTVVTFLQTRRRKLRALKYRGQKLDRINRIETQVEGSLRTTWLSRIILPLRPIVSTAEVHHHHHHHHEPVTKKRNVEKRDAEDSDDSGEDANVLEMLDKYANNAGDSSFNIEDASQESSDSFISGDEEPTIEEETPLPVQPMQRNANDVCVFKGFGAASKKKVEEKEKAQEPEDTKESLENAKESGDSKKSAESDNPGKQNNTEESNKAENLVHDIPTKVEKATRNSLSEVSVGNGSADLGKSEDAKNVNGRSKSEENLEKQQALNGAANSSKSAPMLSSPEIENNENRPMNTNVLPTKEQLESVVKEDDLNALKSTHVLLSDSKANISQKTKQHHSQQANGNAGKKNRNRPSHNYY